MSSSLVEVDSLEATMKSILFLDCSQHCRCLGTFSGYNNEPDEKSGSWRDSIKVMPMEAMCYEAHGLSVLVTATKGHVNILFCLIQVPRKKTGNGMQKDYLGADIS
ncbi:hypothetical protein LARI1_G008514 [Lachnellula arida]|uniref:Uncharacterized protein n=1 Tax=Lachnellula arida TaxID=1316785 RepID=A0A8T9B2L5_9HELO|nr:hypothetical protein LARI1_G008514 [Lachnellula arida]